MDTSAAPATERRQKTDTEIRSELARKGHMAFCWDEIEAHLSRKSVV